MTAIADGPVGWWKRRRRAELRDWAEDTAVEAHERAAVKFKREAAEHRAAMPPRCACDGGTVESGAEPIGLCARCGLPVFGPRYRPGVVR